MKTYNQQAIILGGSIAGLLAARVLAEHFTQVIVIERDALPEGTQTRKGAPHAQHQHALLARGYAVMQELFPGLKDDLRAAGALIKDISADVRWHQGGYWQPFNSGVPAVFISRPALETVVRDPSHAARRPALGSDSNGRHALRPARRFRQLPCGDDGEATPNARQGVADRHLGTGIHPARGALSVMARTVREPVNAGPARLHRVHRRSLSTRGTGPETGPLPRSRSGTAVVSGSRTAVQTGPANRAPGRGPVPDRDRTGTSPFGGGTAVPRASPVQVPAAVPVPGSMPVPRGQAGGPVRTGTVVLRQALRPRRPAPAQGTIRHSRRAGRHVSGHPLTKG